MRPERPTVGRRPAGWLLPAALLLPLGAGCIKQQESLIIVALTADADLPDATLVSISAGKATQTYAITGLTQNNPVQRGIYLDSKTTGNVTVSATAQGGSPCMTYAKSTVVKVSAGAIANAALKLSAAGACGPNLDAGADLGGGVDAGTDGRLDSGAGTGGRAGDAGGTGGTPGTGGRIVPPDGGADARTDGPLLTQMTCREFVHAVTADCSADGTTIIYSVAVSPNGQLVASGGSDGRAKIWRFDGRILTAEGHVFPGMGFATVAFSPDGALLAIGWSNGIDIINTTTWTRQRTLLLSTDSVYDLGFTPNGQQIVSIDRASLYIHNVTATAAVHTLAIPELNWYMAISPVVSPDPVIAIATQNGLVRVFTHPASGFVATGPSLVVDSSGATHTRSVQFSRDGRLLAAGGSAGLLYLWNYPLAATPTSTTVDVGISSLSDYVNAIAFSPDNRVFAVGGGSYTSLSTWTAATRENTAAYLSASDWLDSVVYAPGGNAIIAGEDSCGTLLVCADN